MKVVVTDHRFGQLDQEREAVTAAGGELIDAQVTDESRVIEACRDADAVLTVRAQLSRKVITCMRRCRIIVRYGIGVDNVDIPAATEHGIMVANVPDYCVDEVSDHALALLLMLSRQTLKGIALSKEDSWNTAAIPPLHRLKGRICGLFGAGRIGSLLASKVQALGMKVIVCDPYIDHAHAGTMGAEKVDWNTLLASSDFLSLHAPLVSSTHHIFNQAALRSMKPTAYLINTSRGGLLDEAALIAALDSGEIAGAGLDVLESETAVNIERATLVKHAKVIVTAHTAWLSQEARATLQQRAIIQALACLRGERPYGLLNTAVLQRRANLNAGWQ